MNRFFTSDLHFSHSNIIRYCKRPFDNADEMDECLIANWNSVVTPDDQVWVLGDMFFCNENKAANILRRLHGKIVLLPGNHDTQIMKSEAFKRKFFRILPDLHMERFNGHEISMCHYPLLSWKSAHHGAFMLHGHVHANRPTDGKFRRYDVGVDANGFTPVSWEHIVRTLTKIDPKDSRERDR